MDDPRLYRHYGGPIGSWAFGGAVIAVVAGIVWLAINDPGPRVQTGAVGMALAVMLLGAAVAIGVRALLTPAITVAIDDDAIIVTRRWPWRRRMVRHAAASLAPAMCVSKTDSKDKTVYMAILHVPDGDTITMAVGHDRNRIRAVCDRFNLALFRDPDAIQARQPRL